MQTERIYSQGVKPRQIADPGDAGALPTKLSCYVDIVTAGAETRTLAEPSFVGQTVQLNFKTDGGNCVITVATGINVAGTTTITFTDAGDYVMLVAVQSGANLRWRIVGDSKHNIIADPGDAGAIPVLGDGIVNLVTAGAETRTLADPLYEGQLMQMNFQTDGGDCVVTAASGVNQTGNNTLTFADAGDHLFLQAGRSGANLVWRVVANDGVGLTTV